MAHGVRLFRVLMVTLAFAGGAGCSSSALTETRALELLRAEKDLPGSPDDLKVLGMTDGESEKIVKVEFASIAANVKFRRFDQGWSAELIESDGDWVSLQRGFASLRQRVREAENAVGSLRVIGSAQIAFANVCGAGFYAPSIEALTIGPNGGQPFIGGMGRIPAGGQPLEQRGYLFTMEAPADPSSPASCNGLPAGSLARHFAAFATPKPGNPGATFEIDPQGLRRR